MIQKGNLKFFIPVQGHSGVSSFQKLCSLEKVARAYLIWCENHASENTLQAKPFDFIM